MHKSLKQIRFSVRKYGIWHILALLIALAAIFALPTSALSQSATIVSVEPAELILHVGESGTLLVTVQAIEDFYGFEIQLTFDPDHIQILDADPKQPGIQIQAGDMFDENQGFLVRNQADNHSGELIYAFTLLAPAPEMSGNGSLVEFELEAISLGSSALELEAILASPDGTALRIEIHDGLVTVGNGGTDQPTKISPTTIIPSSTTIAHSQTPSPTVTDENISWSTPSASHTPQATETHFPSVTAGSIGTLTPSVSPMPGDLTPTDSSQEITSTLTPSYIADTPQSQEPTSTLVEMVHPTNLASTEEITDGEVIEQNTSDSKGRDLIFLVTMIIFLAIGFIIGGLYLNRREPNDT
jgi:hypothetical protein